MKSILDIDDPTIKTTEIQNIIRNDLQYFSNFSYSNKELVGIKNQVKRNLKKMQQNANE